MTAVTDGAIQASKEAVTLCITMLGVMTLWTGVLEIGHRSGLVDQLARRMGFPLDWKQLYRLKESDLAYIEDLAKNTVDEKQWESLLHRYMDRYI